MRVHLAKDVRILPNECLTTQVKLEGELETSTQPMIIEADPRDIQIQMVDAILQPTKNGTAQVSLINHLGFPRRLKRGMDIGSAQSVEVYSLWRGKIAQSQRKNVALSLGQTQWMNLELT